MCPPSIRLDYGGTNITRRLSHSVCFLMCRMDIWNTGTQQPRLSAFNLVNVASAKPRKTPVRYVRSSATFVGLLTLVLHSRCPSPRWRTACTRDGVSRSQRCRHRRTTPTLSCAAAATRSSTVRSFTEVWSMPNSTDQRLCLRHGNNFKCSRQAVIYTLIDATFKVVPRLYFSPASAMADFEEASVPAFRCVFGDITVTGCWFHFAQSIIKRVNKVGFKDEYMSEPDVQDGIVSLRRFPFSPGLYHFVG